MSPVRARRVAAEPFHKLLRRARAHRRFEDPAVIQPRLEVVRRCLYNHGGLESFRLHPVDRFDSEIVNQAQAVDSSGTDVNMRALGVFVTQPLDGCLHLEGALPSRRIISPASRRMPRSKRSQPVARNWT